MPLPLADCAADVPTDVCCTTIWDVADRLRCIAFEAVCGCLDATCADREFRSYVSIGPRIPEPLGDALIVHMPDISPSTGSQRPSGTILGVSMQLTQMEIFLTENGWPQIETNELGETIHVPDSNLLNAIARHSYGHGEKMYRAVLNSIQTGAAFPKPANDHIGNIQIAGLKPVQPAAFTVGWRIPLTVQMILR